MLAFTVLNMTMKTAYVELANTKRSAMPLDPFFKSETRPRKKKRSAYILFRKKMKQMREQHPKPKPTWNSRTLDW